MKFLKKSGTDKSDKLVKSQKLHFVQHNSLKLLTPTSENRLKPDFLRFYHINLTKKTVSSILRNYMIPDI